MSWRSIAFAAGGRRTIAVILGLSLARLVNPLPACASEPDAESTASYSAAPAVFREQIDTVVLSWPQIDREIQPTAAQTKDLMEAVSSALVRRGYRVVPTADYRAAWLSVSSLIGNAYDPVTGHADPQRLRATREHVVAALEASDGVDAVITVALEQRAMTIEKAGDSDPGVWSAAGQPLSWNGKKLVAFPGRLPQAVEGVVLEVAIHDAAWRLLYRRSSPLGWLNVYAHASRETQSADVLYELPGLLENAVSMALASVPYRR